MNADNSTPSTSRLMPVIGTIAAVGIALSGAIILTSSVDEQKEAYGQEKAAVEQPLLDQQEATEVAEQATEVLSDAGIVSGEGDIETIYATTPSRLTIVTSYGVDDPREEIRAVAEEAWGAGLSEVDSVEEVEVMVKDADGLNTPMYRLSEDEL